MRAIEESAKEASGLNRDVPMAPAPFILKADSVHSPEGLKQLGLVKVGESRRLVIE